MPAQFFPAQDELFLNRGDGTFENVTERSGILAPNGRGLGIVAADFAGHGKLNLFIANDSAANFFFVNETENADEVETDLPAKSTSSPQSDPETIYTGEMLKSVREKQELTLKEISQRTKINEHILRALEEERFADVPNARVYVRGFVRCLAEEIGLDRDQVVRTYVPRWERWFEEQGLV